MKSPYPTTELEIKNLETKMRTEANLPTMVMGTHGITRVGEADPSGKTANTPGAKLDAGKVCPSLIIEGMARALWGVAEVATFGMMKYTKDGWMLVENGEFRYANAGYRHVLKRAMGETLDPDSELAHLKHEAWNALAKLDLFLREKETSNKVTTLTDSFNVTIPTGLVGPGKYHHPT